MKFEEAFFDELEKIGGMRHYPHPKDRAADEKHWNMRRKWSTILGPWSARKGRKLRTMAGGIVGSLPGGALSSYAALKGKRGAYALGSLLSHAGGMAGHYAAHGKYDPEVSEREHAKYRAKHGRTHPISK